MVKRPPVNASVRREMCGYLKTRETVVVAELNSFFPEEWKTEEYSVKCVFQLDFPDFQCVGGIPSCAVLRICLRQRLHF